MRNKRLLSQTLLLATAMVWGATFVVVKSALADASPLLFNLMRMAMATVVLALVNRRHLRGLSTADIRAGALAGFFLALGYELQTLGLTRTTAAKSAFITGLVVVFVPALTLVPRLRPAGAARPGLAAAAGAALAFAGLLLLTTPAGTRLAALLGAIGAGDLLTLGCALAFAAHLLTLAHRAQHMAAGLLATLQISGATLTMLLLLPLEQHPHASFTPRLWIALAVCSVLATAAAFTIQSYAQQHLPPTQTVVLLTLEPVFAWLTSLLILHQGLDGRSLAGAAMILAGILLIEFLPSARSLEIPA
jgi:drug/metabolite transporter (DMT)-like permease